MMQTIKGTASRNVIFGGITYVLAEDIYYDAKDWAPIEPRAQVKSPEGAISLDFRGKAPGRGAYLCPNSECLKRARKSRALERALDTAIPESVYEEMEKEMANGG